jgi:hypothetical protein
VVRVFNQSVLKRIVHTHREVKKPPMRLRWVYERGENLDLHPAFFQFYKINMPGGLGAPDVSVAGSASPERVAMCIYDRCTEMKRSRFIRYAFVPGIAAFYHKTHSSVLCGMMIEPAFSMPE